MRTVILIALACVMLLPQTVLSRQLGPDDARTAGGSAVVGPDPGTHADEDSRAPGKTELSFDPASQTVTIKMWVHGAGGTVLPDIRPENFAVYENGVRQPQPAVEIERLPVTLGILLEYGGRHSALNAALGDAISAAVRQFEDELSPEDKVAFWRYSDRVEELSGFSGSRDQWLRTLSTFGSPPLSETNLYDALIDAVGRLGAMSGRKALVLVSSGLDTFSNHGFEAALEAIRRAAVPVYVINLDRILEEDASINAGLARPEPVNWQRATRELREIAKVSGGHMYSPQSDYGWSGTFDNLIDSLRVRYVITYRSAAPVAASVPRRVRIEILDPRTGGPLRSLNADGQPTRERIVAEDRYTPGPASDHRPATAAAVSAADPGTGASVPSR